MPNGFWTDGAFSPRSKNKFLVEFGFNDISYTGISGIASTSTGLLAGIQWCAKSATPPSFEIGKEEVKNNIGACQRHVFPRKMIWKPVTVVLADPINHRTADPTVLPWFITRGLTGKPLKKRQRSLAKSARAARKHTGKKSAQPPRAPEKRPKTHAESKANVISAFMNALQSAFEWDSRIYKGALNVKKSHMNDIFDYIIIKSLNDYGEIIDQWKLNNIILTSMDMGTLSYTDDAPFELTLTFEYEWASYTVDPENTSGQKVDIFPIGE